MHASNKFIIHADDFGYSEAVNGAVLRSFQRWLITSSSLLVNMPGFSGAVDLVHANPLLSGKIGVCLNLSEGYSLTSAIRNYASFCQTSGAFILKEGRRLLLLNLPEKQAVYEELRAQLETALMAGVRPTHLSMHHSLHRQWAITGLLTKLGREYGIPRMRFLQNIGPQFRGVKGYYRLLFNRMAWKYSGVGGPDFAGGVSEFQGWPEKRRPSGKNIEIIVHPVLDEYGDLVDRDGKGLQLKLRPVIDHRHTITYAQLPVLNEGRSLAGFVGSLVRRSSGYGGQQVYR